MQRAFARILRDAKGNAKGATFVASTDVEARDGMVIDQATWRVDSYKSNPVVLFAHDYSQLPVGKATRIEVVEGRLEIDVAFDVGHELGATVARQVAEGFLNAVSVGWGSARYQSRDGLEKADKYYSEDGGTLVRDMDLLEVSIVPVPADPLALAQRGYLDGLAAWVRANVPDESKKPAEPMPWDVEEPAPWDVEEPARS